MSPANVVKPKGKINLSQIDPEPDKHVKRQPSEQRLAELGQELTELQELLYAAGQQSLLIVLQGMDTSGKDGTIRAVGGFFNPQGCRVESFKVPTPLELSHDFLWRVHSVTPPRGQVTIFNRSHYEDVLVVRVHDLVPETVWRKRYEHINDFEQLLADNNTIIVKIFLHIDRDEQKERLLEREKEVEKAWKLSAGDWAERQFWDDYMDAYQEVFERCSTKVAPWYIVPANEKWYRNLVVAETLAERLRPYRKDWLAILKARGEKELAAVRQARSAQAASDR